MLREGDIIKVSYQKKIVLPDDKTYFLVIDETQKKFLLPFIEEWEKAFSNSPDFYCLVDKINCSGKIYLEPLHPNYQIGKQYPFRYIGSKSITTDYGDNRYFLHFEDEFKNKANVLSINPYTKTVGEIVDCTIIGIKRSQIQITVELEAFVNFTEGKEYPLLLEKIIENKKEEKLFLFRDSFGGNHTALFETFAHYNLMEGNSYNCRIKKFTDSGDFKIEPKNPYYNENKVYGFKFVEKRIEKDLTGMNVEVIIVIDVFGKEAAIVLYPEDFLERNSKENLPARVRRINNARLYLEAE